MVEPEILRRLMSYNPDTGVMNWRPRDPEMFANPSKCSQWNTRYSSAEALGNVDSTGYKRGAVFNKIILAHRAAWAIYYGVLPEGQIDHINGIRSDNRISNLRDVSVQGNCRNAGLRRDNTSGVSGVSVRNGRFIANIRHAGKKVYLGSFNTLDAAASARIDAMSRYGYSDGHGSIRSLKRQ